MENLAFVLGGGSIKGARQIGSVNYVLENGIYPDILTGISVGNLNANLLANKVGEHFTNYPNKEVNWHEISYYLRDFWFDNITCPDDLAIKKGVLKLIWELARGKFNGFSDTTPLRNLIEKTVQIRYLKASKIDLEIGCVNIEEGKIIYVSPSHPNYIQYMMASSAIPFMMPVEKIGQLKFLDGGLIDSAPIGQAIKMGAKKIIVFANHPEKVGHRTINHNNPLELADRLMSIIVNNTLNNDLMEAELINQLLINDIKCSRTVGKKIIDIKVIRPKATTDLKIDDFNKADIERIWKMGWDDAKNCKLW